MGVYKFRWYGLLLLTNAVREARPLMRHSSCRNQPAQKVIVTGSFDNWSGSESLDKVDDGFEKAVRIDNESDKVYYKVSGILFPSAIYGCMFDAQAVSLLGWFPPGWQPSPLPAGETRSDAV